MIKACGRGMFAALIVLLVAANPVSAQITTGNVTGTVKDAQGGVVPGATVVLISEARGTKLAPVTTNEVGVYVIPNVTADTYTVEVSMDGFKTVKRQGIKVSGGDRVAVPQMTLEVGGATETVNVTAEAALVQSQSAERSFAISTEQVDNLPISHGNFINFAQLTPGVQLSTTNVGGDNRSAGATRIGTAGQNNIMMDGISAMDTGNNGQMLALNVESIAEVKVLTQGYQAEFGRSSGLQVTAVTKSGTNRFRGSAYDLLTDSDWNTNRKLNELNKDPKPKSDSKTLGYSIGGPVGKPGGNNKLFFFYSHEYRPTNQAINAGNPIRIKVPTALERAGDFSQTVDNNGQPLFIKDPLISGTCSATDQTACFPGGKIPANRLYGLGQAILNRYPLPNLTQTAGLNYNYQIGGGGGYPDLPTVDNLVQQPAIRLDYQLSSKLRVTGKYSGQRERVLTRPGLIPGFTDVLFPYPFITNYAITTNYAINPTTFLEGTYGFIRNELTGGNENGILMNDQSNRLNALPGFPLIYPDAGLVPQESYAYEVLNDTKPPFWDGTRMNLPPVFAWGGRIAPNGNNNLPAPPNQRYPGWLNINRTQDVAISLTKVAGRHTYKGGFYNNHSFKAQNVGAGGIANLTFQGFVDFGNNANNALDSGYGYSNAVLGIYNQYLQASKFVEGSMLYNNTEGYIQDNWKVNSRLTLDYGLRLTHQQPQYDQFQQMSNFFPEQWSLANAPFLYVPGCIGASPCSGNNLNAMDPRNNQILTVPGIPNTQAAIGTPIPGTGNSLNGIVQAGNGIAKTGYTWPNIVYGPRFGAAYDVSGNQSLVFRGGAGLFYDRPDGNTVFSIPGNPPIATSTDLRFGFLQNVGQAGGLAFGPVPAMVTFQYEAKVPASVQWQAGFQKTLPWASVVDLTYVGSHGYNRLGGFQGGTTVNLNAIDFGTAYLPQYQDTTKGPSAFPAQNALSTNLLRPYRGLSNISQNTTEFHDTYHSLQANFNRRFRNGFSFGANYVLSLSYTGNTGLQKRLQHAADGSVSVRADQADYEKLNEQQNLQRHLFKANWVWDLPDYRSDNTTGKILGQVVNNWQISGLFTGGSGSRFDLNYGYQSGIGQVNITGSPDYNGRVIINGDLGKGCSSNQFAQWNTAAVSGPQYGSVGLESGRNYLIGCPDHTTDLAIARNFPFGGGRQFQLRLDAYNAFNIAFVTGRQTTANFRSPSDMTLTNAQYVVNPGDTTLAPGASGTVLAPGRDLPRNAGFGAANNWSTNAINNNYGRFIQLTMRVQF